jgi:hypothetical protein
VVLGLVLGKGRKLFFTRKKVFALSPSPSPTFKKSGVLWGLALLAPGYVARGWLRWSLAQGMLHAVVCGVAWQTRAYLYNKFASLLEWVDKKISTNMVKRLENTPFW